MSVRRVDQDMATAAAGMLLPADRLTSADQKALRTRYRQLRIMLHTAGLAATYAFVTAKSGSTGALERAYAEAARGIRERLASRGLLTGDPARADAREILHQLGKMDAMDYARASAEVEAFMGWLSRLADACYQHDEQIFGTDETGS